MELISIIVPIYNTGDFLNETIESVIRQTCKEWELILVDDGSTDHSADICKKYVAQDNRIQYHYKANGGQASARNFGLEVARGKYITLLDSDDLYLEDKLEIQLKEFTEQGADFMFGGSILMYEEDEGRRTEELPVESKIYSGAEFFNLLYRRCPVNANTVFFERALLDQVGRFDESRLLVGTEDWDMWLRIAKVAKKVFASPSIKIYYRIHPEGTHFKKVQMLTGKWNIYEKYENEGSISGLRKKREFRRIARDLFFYLQEEGRAKEIKPTFKKYFKKDPINLVALNQFFLVHLLGPKSFIWISHKLLYRIGRRLEQFTYFLFIRQYK